MKVQCDVCAAEAASVFCCADEAALCEACDRRVHRANKLAGKHRRFSLVPSSSSSSSLSSSFPPQFGPPPLCDICQKKRGLIFCQEDRAILCCDCDVAIHAASELTMRHSRFLLAGIRLSSAPLHESKTNKLSTAEDVRCHSKVSGQVTLAAEEQAVCSSSRSNGSSISEYLINTIPGWQVDEFLTDDAAAAAAAAAANRSYQGVEINHYCDVGEGFLPTWVPQEQFFYEGVGAQAEDEAAAVMVPQMYNDWRGGGGGGGNKRSRNCLSYW